MVLHLQMQAENLGQGQDASCGTAEAGEGSIAQSVEHRPFKSGVVRSSRTGPADMHNLIVVLLHSSDVREAEMEATSILSDFDMNLDVDPYEVDCDCSYSREKDGKFGPDPNCTECSGTGTYTSMYNSNGEYDWYTFGGRWDGVLTCTRRSEKPRGANFEDNFMAVAKLLTSKQLVTPCAVVTPDGEWIRFDLGNLGNYAYDLGNPPAELIDLYTKHKDCFAVGVDIHF